MPYGQNQPQKNPGYITYNAITYIPRIFSGLILAIFRFSREMGFSNRSTIDNRKYCIVLKVILFSVFLILKGLLCPVNLFRIADTGWNVCSHPFSLRHPANILQFSKIDLRLVASYWPLFKMAVLSANFDMDAVFLSLQNLQFCIYTIAVGCPDVLSNGHNLRGFGQISLILWYVV